jgi:hypothetical protein
MNLGMQPIDGLASRRLAKSWEDGMHSRRHPRHGQRPSNRERKASVLQPSLTDRGWVGREEPQEVGVTVRDHDMTVRNTRCDVRAFIY